MAKMATAGSVSRLFHRKGQIMIARDAANEDELMELALEAGAEDFKAEDEGYEVLTAPEDFEAVHQAIEAKGIAMETAEITQLPEMGAPVSSEAELEKVHKLRICLKTTTTCKACIRTPKWRRFIPPAIKPNC